MNESELSLPNDANSFRLTSVGVARRAGFTAANRPTVVLDPSRIPPSLRPLIPFAERWGIPDDIIREDIFQQASPLEIQQLATILRQHDDALDTWLAGPESSAASPSLEYVAFSAMRMGVDFL